MHNYLKKHPTPWRYIEYEYNHDGKHGEGLDIIEDANGEAVLYSGDPNEYQSWIIGAEELVEFINNLPGE